LMREPLLRVHLRLNRHNPSLSFGREKVRPDGRRYGQVRVLAITQRWCLTSAICATASGAPSRCLPGLRRVLSAPRQPRAHGLLDHLARFGADFFPMAAVHGSRMIGPKPKKLRRPAVLEDVIDHLVNTAYTVSVIGFPRRRFGCPQSGHHLPTSGAVPCAPPAARWVFLTYR
jgi:hypothetical protein